MKAYYSSLLKFIANILMVAALSSCVTFSNEDISPTATSKFLMGLSQIPEGKGRIIFYIEDRENIPLTLPLALDGNIIGNLKIKNLAFIDVKSGSITLSNQFYKNKNQIIYSDKIKRYSNQIERASSTKISLGNGETKYIELKAVELHLGTEDHGYKKLRSYVYILRMRVIDPQQAKERIRSIDNPIWGGL